MGGRSELVCLWMRSPFEVLSTLQAGRGVSLYQHICLDSRS